MMGVCGDFVSDDENVLVLLGGLMCALAGGRGESQVDLSQTRTSVVVDRKIRVRALYATRSLAE